MIQFRHHPDRTVELNLEDVEEGEWNNIPYSPYYFRVWLDKSNDVSRMEIKHEDDIEWADYDDWDEDDDSASTLE